MAREKRINKNGRILKRFRPGPGAKEVCVTVDNPAEAALVDLYVEMFRSTGQVGSKAGALAFVAQHRPPADTSNFELPTNPDAGFGDTSTFEAQFGHLTLAEFIGKPCSDQPGAFFAIRSGLEPRTQTGYEYRLNTVWKRWANYRMREFSAEVLDHFRDELFVCQTCARPVVAPPNGCKNHTYIGKWNNLRPAFMDLRMVLKTYGTKGASDIKLSRSLIKLAATPPKEGTSLDIAETERLLHSAPDDGYVPLLFLFKLGLRSSEVRGLTRASLFGRADSRGAIAVSARTVRYPRSLMTVPGAKTDDSRAWLPAPTRLWSALIEYVRIYRSTPDPERCAACRDGVALDWFAGYEGSGPNPHKHCPMADDAPLLVGRRGKPIKGEYYLKVYLAEAAAKAGIPTPKIRDGRTTFGTALGWSAMSPAMMRSFGRWTGVTTQVEHYVHPTREMMGRLLDCVDLGARLQAGLGNLTEAEVRRVAGIMAEVLLRRTVNAVLCGDASQIGCTGDATEAATALLTALAEPSVAHPSFDLSA